MFEVKFMILLDRLNILITGVDTISFQLICR